MRRGDTFLNQPDKRPKMGVTRGGNGAMRGRGAG